MAHEREMRRMTDEQASEYAKQEEMRQIALNEHWEQRTRIKRG